MKTKKILAIVLACVAAAFFGFTTWWTIDNRKALGAFFSGTDVYTTAERDAAYADGVGEKERADKKAAEYRETITTLTAEAVELNNQIADIQNQVTILTSSNGDKDKTIASLTGNNQHKDSVIASLNAQIATLQGSVSNLTAQISTLTSNINSLTTDNGTLTAMVAQLQLQAATFNNTIARLNSIIKFYGDRITELENRTEFTVNFHVGDEIHDTQLITSYPITTLTVPQEPEIDGKVFAGWSLDGVTVVDPIQFNIITDFDFYAVFGVGAISFATDTEEIIARVIEQVSNGADPMDFPYQVGDQRDITLTTGESLTFSILGIQHDDLADGSGKATYTLGMDNLLATQYVMNSSYTNIGGWGLSEMRNNTFNSIFNQLPIFWQSMVKTVTKKTSAGDKSTTIQLSNDKLFLFAEEEIYGVNKYGSTGEGVQYDYWKTIKNGANPAPTSSSPDRVKKRANGTGNASTWWLRSPNVSNSAHFCNINSSGNASPSNAPNFSGVCFGFCV